MQESIRVDSPITADQGPRSDRAALIKWARIYFALLLVIPVISLLILVTEGPRVRRDATEALDAIGQSKAAVIRAWLAERQTYARIMMADPDIVDGFMRWTGGRDQQARQHILDHARSLQDATGGEVELFEFHQLADKAGHDQGDLLARAMASGEPQFSELHLDAASLVWIDQVIPIVYRSGQRMTPLGGLLVHLPVSASLFPIIQSWPTPSDSAETLMVRPDGRDVLFLNELRHRKDTALRLRLPLDSQDLPAAQAIRAGKHNRHLEGQDYRGVSVLASTLPIAGTDWYLVTKIDYQEVMRPLYRLVLWAGTITSVAVLGVGLVLMRLWRQEAENFQLGLQARTGQQDRLLAQFYNLPFMGMVVIDPVDGHCLHVNDGLCHLLGFERAELLQHPGFNQLIHPDDQAANAGVFERLRQGDVDSFRQELSLRRKEGGYVQVEMAVRCIRRPDRTLEYVIKTVRDLTESRLLMEVAQRNQQQLLGFIEQAPVSMAMFDRDMTYLACSRHWLRDFGRGLANLIGRNLYAVHPDLKEEWCASHRRALGGESIHNEGDLWLQEDGSKRWLRWSVVPWRNELGAIGGIIVTVEDVTDLKLAEQTLLEADDHKNNFMAQLAHEMRNPLTPISVAAQMLQAPDIDLNSIRWAGETIAGRVDHVTRMIDDLLDVTRIAQGHLALKPERLELAGIVRMAVEAVSVAMAEKRQNLHLDLPDQPVHLHGDPVRLTQVFTNLLGNAAKYTPEAGHIALRAWVEQGELVVKVEDDGMGIPPGLLPHVFELFRQEERVRKYSRKGLGIGLNLVERLVALHGGRIKAESAGIDQGSTFTIWLPMPA